MATTDSTMQSRPTPEQVAELHKALTASPADPCPVTLDQIEAYIKAQLAGVGTLEAFRTLSQHLSLCQSCVSSYTRLYRALLAEKEGRLGQTTPARHFDLPFLPAAPTLMEQVQAALQQIGETITLQLSAALLQSCAPAPALALRGPGDEPFFTLEPDEALRAQWPATVTAYRDANQPDVCTVKVQVKPLGRPFPHRKGIQVTLSSATARWQASTDAYGNALLTGIPVAQLPTLKIDLVL